MTAGFLGMRQPGWQRCGVARSVFDGGYSRSTPTAGEYGSVVGSLEEVTGWGGEELARNG
jgi:hypothetical protein